MVDEPYGRLDGLKIDTLWRNIRKLGRTTNYNHTLDLTYAVPINKIPYMDWATLNSRYTTHFTGRPPPSLLLTTRNLM
ncbi:hypothetical protein HK413_12665 [Mucilaginibacter sp. S1162]|uniref:Uncharacterized protein n=1 Tax=Mucilaginibacter humi TaxID=2732510 RepID=A0ABX1W5W5_9SPHI|nr:hypothetical protein [Mucilaginibacter humi]NNU34699.1 hypothetical protein [Mucilaginibacter humi]